MAETKRIGMVILFIAVVISSLCVDEAYGLFECYKNCMHECIAEYWDCVVGCNYHCNIPMREKTGMPGKPRI
ncbi:hypothetical protein C5167_016184 [Papaver somniferum]|nr:hypothetical protein C5167_016184 [Papaver somniferum]